MATKLTKPVKRETTMTDRKGKTIIVELLPSNLISFRRKGGRKTVEIGLGHCHVLAEILDENYYYKMKLEQYKERKKAGLKVRKPKRPKSIYSKFYYRSL